MIVMRQTRCISFSNSGFLLGIAKCEGRKFSSALTQAEYTEVPEYPPILDTSNAAVSKRKQQSWHEKIKSLRTVEEKLIELNMPKYYGWGTYMLNESNIPYNSLPFVQYITRTHYACIEDLPAFYTCTGIADKCHALLDRIKHDVEAAILFEYKFQRRKHDCLDEEDKPTPEEQDEINGKHVLNQINRAILSNLSLEFPHLLECQVECEPRIESFWFVGGLEPTARVKKMRKNNKNYKYSIDKPHDRPFQFIGSPILQLRHGLPLCPIVSREECTSSNFHVPAIHYDPRVFGFLKKYRHGTNIPGFWPGDPCEFGMMSFHHRARMCFCPSYRDVEQVETLQAQAILTSYSWLLAQASYQGFSTFNDVTYPLVTQTVISNGQYWSFYVYQLNTTLLHSEHALQNPLCNMCWGTGIMKLFDGFEDGKVIGFNDNALRMLLAFYLNVPSIREGVELKPYLGAKVKHVADLDDVSCRCFLEKRFKHMYSNRPRHRLAPEVYSWEKIYKIDHNTRPLEARRRPFELGINPFDRRYDDHQPEYIPKVLRSEENKRKKWATTYYP